MLSHRHIIAFVLNLVVLTECTYIPVIDMGSLRSTTVDDNYCRAVAVTAKAIYSAAVEVGFFYVRNHGVDPNLVESLDEISRNFFALPVEQKKQIDMAQGGKAWRGFFAVGDEVTSGIPDQKEGIYFGTELSVTEARDRPLHGTNQWPQGELGDRMRETVIAYLSEMKTVGQLLMRAVSCSLNVTDESFSSQFTHPTELFRIFNYPPHNPVFGDRALGVGEHTDYGYLTLLRQDDRGGLQVKDTPANVWRDAAPIPGTFVVNLGDALEHATWGLFKATPHRVVQRVNATTHRLSMPYFFDPCFECEMRRAIPEEVARAASQAHSSDLGSVEVRATAPEALSTVPAVQTGDAATVREQGQGLYTRWDGADPTMFTGTYGSYLLRKVSRAFPALFEQHIGQ
jgi:isopenicillin N synthase-like dioxygenase